MWNCEKIIRHWLVELHRYSGLLLSLFIVMTGLTGSTLAFNDEIDAWLNPQFYHVAASGERLPLDQLVGVIEHHYPHARLTFFAIDADPNAPLQARLRPKKAEDALAADTVFIDPFNAAVIGESNSKALSLAPQNLMLFLFRLHRYRLLDKTGAIISGSLGLLWLVTLLIGFALAWLRHGSGMATAGSRRCRSSVAPAGFV